MAVRVFNGTKNADVFTATTGDDWTFYGLGGGDTLTGNTGNDTFFGGFGNDILDGADGDDTFRVVAKDGVDTYIGGSGFDRILADANNVAIGIRSLTGIEAISANGFSGVTIIGSTAADTLDFTGVTLTGIGLIDGAGGDDTITGTSGDDRINGGTGNDVLNGGDGDDTFLVSISGGFDTFNGGTGVNRVEATGNNVQIGLTAFSNIQTFASGGFANVQLVGTAGDDYIDLSLVTLEDVIVNGANGNDTIIGTFGDDTLRGGNGNDRLVGGEGNDTIDGNGGLDQLEGGAGDDIFLVGAGGAGANSYRGGEGYDVIYANAENAVVILGTNTLYSIEEISSNGFGNFQIAGTAGNDWVVLTGVTVFDGDIAAINAGDGDDIFKTTKFGDILFGGNGNDRLESISGDDTVSGGQGDDYIDGGAGSDTINGNNNNDTIIGGQGIDFLFGDAGDDVFVMLTGHGADAVDGGTGIDTIRAGANGTQIQLGTFTGIEMISGGGFNNVTIVGTADVDVFDFTNIQLTGIKSINAGASGDTIIGSKGNDVIVGVGGDDTLSGGDGADTITGGTGLDILTGGAGNDIFRDGIKNLTGDTITDFEVGDRIQITNASNPGAMTFAYAGGVLTIDPDGAGALKAFAINLPGAFTSSGFQATSDGAGGTFVTYF